MKGKTRHCGDCEVVGSGEAVALTNLVKLALDWENGSAIEVHGPGVKNRTR